MSPSPKRNWTAVAGFVLGLAGAVGYFGVVVLHNPRLGWLIHTPILQLLSVGLGLILSTVGMLRAFHRTHGGRVAAPFLGLLNLALSSFLVWHLFVATYRLPTSANAPAVGTAAPDFELRNQHGDLVRLSSFRGRSVVLLFYRGFW